MPSRSDAGNPKNPLLKIDTSSPDLRGFDPGTGKPADTSLAGFSYISSTLGTPKNDPKSFGGVSAAGGTPGDTKLGGFADCSPSDYPEEK